MTRASERVTGAFAVRGIAVFFQRTLSLLLPPPHPSRVFPPDCSCRPPVVNERAPVCRMDRGQIVPGWLSGAYTDAHKHPESH